MKPYNGPYTISEGVPNSYIGTFVAIDLDGDGTGIKYNITGEYSGKWYFLSFVSVAASEI